MEGENYEWKVKALCANNIKNPAAVTGFCILFFINHLAWKESMQKLDNCIIYIRVSDPSQVENNSLETQEKACENTLKKKSTK